ncbi:MAG: acyl carrier protein [Candidatus Omnitrophica bacterium]|nr:acyl carrier protein [Candidatus Omnitrophota bacterium]
MKIIEENLEEKVEFNANTDLRDELGLDSFAMVIIVNALEDEFGISIDAQDYRDINNVVDIVKSLKQYCPDLKES